MSDINDQLADLIKQAIDLEINSKRLYQHAAETTKNELGRKMFERLVKAEEGHLDSVGEIFTEILGNDDWKEIAERELEGATPSTIVEDLKKAVAGWTGKEEHADDVVALRMAMEMERKAIHYFEELSKKSHNPKVLEMIKKLIDEETFHYDILQSQRDSILNMGIWLDSVEFQMDGKY